MRLSVIICTRNRGTKILECLDSVVQALQNVMHIKAEIVVVDNGSTDDTAQIVTTFAETCPFVLRAVSEPQRGLSRARNTGVRASRGKLLVFTDDDCQLSPTYIKEAITHDDNDKELLLRSGPVELGDPTDIKISYRLCTLTMRWNNSSHPNAQGQLNGTCIGANMTMRRALFDVVGDFDVRFGAGGVFFGGEETDYAYRVYMKGFSIESVPDMKVYHFHGRKDAKEAVALTYKYSIGLGALYAKHLSSDIGWLRPLYWALRNAIRHPLNACYFSARDKFSNMSHCRGVFDGFSRYIYYSLRPSKISRHFLRRKP